MLCANRAWSTVGTDDPIDSDWLLEICHVKLVYIGHNMFGELREKSVLPVSSYPAIKDTTCVTVSGTNKTIADINVCFEPPTADEEYPALDTHDYVDSSELSVLDDYSDDTIIYPLPVNSDNMLESPLLNINNTTDRPIGTGYYTRLDENGGEIPCNDIASNVATPNTVETSVTTVRLNCESLGNHDTLDVSDTNLECDYNVQITDNSPDNIAAGVNTESDHNVQGTIDSSVSGLNKMQENIVSGINVTDDHNYAMKGINSAELTGKNKNVDTEFSDVNGRNGEHIMENVQSETNTKSSNVDIEPKNIGLPKEAEKHDSIIDGNSSTDTTNKLCNLFLVKNPEAALYRLWKNDAIKNRLTLKIKKLTKEETYLMSHPTPNWSAIDPYSSLEEILSDSENEKETDSVSTQNNKCAESTSDTQCYFMRERKMDRPSRSLRGVAMHNYKEDSEDNDSDYTPVLEVVQNVNPGLRHPSKESMNAQCQITVNRERLGLPVSNINKNVGQSSSELTDRLLDATNSNTGVSASNPVFSTKSTPPIPPTPAPSSPACNNPVTSVHALASATSSSLHKRKPKQHGKHRRPASQLTSDSSAKLDSTNTQSVTPQPKSEFVTKQYGIIKCKKARKITCPMCKHGAYSQADANKHYRLSHPPIKCSKCPQLFNNPCSLRRHFYSHQDRNFPCQNCGKNFPFESDLAAHRMKYRRHPGYMCNHDVDGKICGKWYFSRSDLTKHALTHTGKVHECLECGFTTLDKRYLRAHLYTHSDKMRYKCENCGEPFKHHTQLVCHQKKCT